MDSRRDETGAGVEAPVALITGITGQDGAYLSRLLLEKGYEVHGIVRRSSSFNTGRIDEIRKDLHLHYGDMGDASSLLHIVEKTAPTEIYNLAAQSHVAVSFEIPEYTAQSDALGPLRLLEAIRTTKVKARYYQASTSELYGNGSVSGTILDENSPMIPRSPYGAAKLYAYHVVKNYREAYGIFACNGILFNHESPIRGENFVTKKVCMSAARRIPVRLGNLDAVRDWGHARDYVEAMWLMLQQSFPGDYVIATGEGHSVMDLVKEAYGYMGLDPMIEIDPEYIRPLDVDYLVGNPQRAWGALGWKPKIKFKELIQEMMEYECAAVG